MNSRIKPQYHSPFSTENNAASPFSPQGFPLFRSLFQKYHSIFPPQFKPISLPPMAQPSSLLFLSPFPLPHYLFSVFTPQLVPQTLMPIYFIQLSSFIAQLLFFLNPLTIREQFSRSLFS